MSGILTRDSPRGHGDTEKEGEKRPNHRDAERDEKKEGEEGNERRVQHDGMARSWPTTQTGGTVFLRSEGPVCHSRGQGLPPPPVGEPPDFVSFLLFGPEEAVLCDQARTVFGGPVEDGPFGAEERSEEMKGAR